MIKSKSATSLDKIPNKAADYTDFGLSVKMQKPQATCGFASKEKERKNEKGDIRRYATIIQGKCEDYK